MFLLCKEYRTISKKSGTANEQEFKLITQLAGVAKVSLQKHKKEQVRYERLKKNKKTDKGQALETKLTVAANLVPLLLRDKDGNLYYASIGRVATAKIEDAIFTSENTANLKIEFFHKIILFTLTGESILARIEQGHLVIEVPVDKNGVLNYDQNKLAEYTKIKNTLSEIPIDNRENCIGHTVTSETENIWINPVHEDESLGRTFNNVEKMILSANCKEIGANEDDAKSGDLIAFKATEELVEKSNLKLRKEDIGAYIHAAIYNGENKYSSKNGKRALNKSTTLVELTKLYGTSYTFHRPSGIVNRIIINEEDGIKNSISSHYDEILFRGRSILTKDEIISLSKEDLLERAEEKMKKLASLNKKQIEVALNTIRPMIKKLLYGL